MLLDCNLGAEFKTTSYWSSGVYRRRCMCVALVELPLDTLTLYLTPIKMTLVTFISSIKDVERGSDRSIPGSPQVYTQHSSSLQ